VDTRALQHPPDQLTCGDDVHGLWSPKRRGETGLPDRYRAVVARPRSADPIAPAAPDIEVRRSARRRRTVSAYRDGDRTVVLIPARFSKAEERRWVAEMLARLQARELRRVRGPRRSDQALLARARHLSATVLDGRPRPVSVRWVTNMAARWGSCTPSDGTIRVSSRLRDMPGWVLDYVIVHELVHLLVPGHGAEFWELVRRYPRADRARGYLEGVAAAAHLDWGEPADDEPPEVDPGALPGAAG
jgi:predicted metal-dependent hydrolase